MPSSTVDPVAIDTDLATFHQELGITEARLEQAQHYLGLPLLPDEQRETMKKSEKELTQRIEELLGKIEPLETLYRENLWTRAFLVNNSNGHVHRDMRCSTCFSTTSYLWLTEYSGSEESAIVEAAGTRACTVCYPDAPVELLSRPSRIKSDEERSREERDSERARKREEQAAKELIDPETGTLVLSSEGRELRTERAARNEVSSCLQNLAHYNHFYGQAREDIEHSDHPETETWKSAVFRIAAALAVKHETAYDEVMFDLASRAIKTPNMKELGSIYSPLTVETLYGLLA